MRRVAPSPRLGLVERRAEPHCHECVLERDARAIVRMDIPGRDARHAHPLGQLAQVAVATPVVARERTLDLDPEALRTERPQEPPRHHRRVRILAALDSAAHRPVARAARQADEPL